jgi:hypothetical protein
MGLKRDLRYIELKRVLGFSATYWLIIDRSVYPANWGFVSLEKRKIWTRKLVNPASYYMSVPDREIQNTSSINKQELGQACFR